MWHHERLPCHHSDWPRAASLRFEWDTADEDGLAIEVGFLPLGFSAVALPGYRLGFMPLVGGTTWLEPVAEEATPSMPQPFAPVDADIVLVSKVIMHLVRRGRPVVESPRVVAAAWPLCAPAMPRRQLLGRLRRIQGLDGLPSCWLADFVRWADRNPGIAGVIDAVAVREGILLPRLHPSASAGDAVVWIPAMLNGAIYPSLWRPLRRVQRARLMVDRPDLREDISR